MDLRILEATRRLISGEDSHLIPKDNRELVERATHPEVLETLAQELGAKWETHAQDIEGVTIAEMRMAHSNSLQFSEKFIDEAGNKLKFSDDAQFISSRLGAADYILEFVPPLPGPFAQEVRRLPIRHHMWPAGESPDSQPLVLSVANDGSFTFAIGASIYRYSRLGLERITDSTIGANQ
jgi:CRISPR-associated endonuclease/helicase Cas3